ncbi:hypothetical protein ACP70R_045758 [Stipagrostis hirtigluma subsp. patula]
MVEKIVGEIFDENDSKPMPGKRVCFTTELEEKE